MLHQVEGRFITDYAVFSQRPMDRSLVNSALRSYAELFGSPPRELATDKGFSESSAKIEMLADGRCQDRCRLTGDHHAASEAA